jgi:hypothetical protein
LGSRTSSRRSVEELTRGALTLTMCLFIVVFHLSGKRLIGSSSLQLFHRKRMYHKRARPTLYAVTLVHTIHHAFMNLSSGLDGVLMPFSFDCIIQHKYVAENSNITPSPRPI